MGNPGEAVLGPRHTSVTPGRTLPGVAATVWAVLRELTRPASLDELAEASGLLHETVREHLDELVEDGLVVGHAPPPDGDSDDQRWSVAEERSTYAGLAVSLAASIDRLSTDPSGDALVAGEGWGSDLALERRAAPDSATGARREVIGLMAQLGFAPVPDAAGSVVRLRECPLLSTALRQRDVVCGVHLGIVRGALAEFGGEPDRTRLEAFAEPGACVLHLHHD
ncbi:MAG: transcriptional regulator [Nocardioidaceae bacterium]